MTKPIILGSVSLAAICLGAVLIHEGWQFLSIARAMAARA
jgi:hypothetical protein